MDDQPMNRRTLLALAAAGAAGLAASACGGSPAASALPSNNSADTAVGDIYRLQAAFHRAKTTQDLDFMMSLWAEDATLVAGSPPSTIRGASDLRTYWTGTGSFKSHRFSLVPSFKTQIKVTGDKATLYFECHDVADFETTPKLVNDTFLGGTLKRVNGRWLFYRMTAGSSSPLSIEHQYLAS